MSSRYIEIESLDNLTTLAAHDGVLQHYAFQCIDFGISPLAPTTTFDDCIFLGCNIPDDMQHRLRCNCIVFPCIDAPYKVFPAALYTAKTLYEGYEPHDMQSYEHCYDALVYKHYLAKGKTAKDIKETLTRTLHDHSISDALHDVLAHYDERDVVAVMGGHSLLRTDECYRRVAQIARRLTEQGKLVVSGGGPGAMEATHLGAYMAHRPDSDLLHALQILAQAPSYKDAGWLSTAFNVIKTFPRQQETHDIGVPTWFYGHEPATPFAAHIAKYFDNSIREDGLLTIAKGGVIFAPGSAGTMQEIFQDAAQNHYETFGYASPMVFLDTQYWTAQTPVYPFLQELLSQGRYRNLILSLVDDVADAIEVLAAWRKLSV